MKPIRRSARVLAPLCAAIILLPLSAHAIPAFARKYNVGCETCHVAFPLLNATGERFREAGYRLVGEHGEVDESIQGNRKVAPGLTLGPDFPVSAFATGWVFLATRDDHAQIRPVTEAAVLVAGNWAAKGSVFLEVGAEDEGGWVPEVGAQVGYHPSRYVNLLAATKGPFHPDPYNTFRAPLTQTPNSSTDRIAGEDIGRPTLELWGRASSLYYAGALTVAADNPLGIRPWLGFGRAAVDLSDRNMVGAFALAGRQDAGPGEPERSLLRTGVDWNLGWGRYYLIGVAAVLREETEVGHDTDVTSSMDVFYTLPLSGGRLLIPLLRPEFNTFSDREETELSAAGGLYLQFLQNGRAGVEARGDLKPRVAGERAWGVGLNVVMAL